MTLLDKGETDVSSDVENIEVANGYESDCKTHLNNPFKWWECFPTNKNERIVGAILSVPYVGAHSRPNTTKGAKTANWYFLSRLYFVDTFAAKIYMKNSRLASFSIGIEHKNQKWLATREWVQVIDKIRK